MPTPATLSTTNALAALTAYTWSPQPAPARFVQRILSDLVERSPFAAELSQRMLTETGTRLVDWLDHIGLPIDDPALRELPEVGYVRSHSLDGWEHRQGLFPRIREVHETSRKLAIKVESVVDFLAAHGLTGVTVEGAPLGRVRAATVARENNVEVLAIERRGSLAFDPDPVEQVPLAAILHHGEALRLRRRDFANDDDGFIHAIRLIESAIVDLGRDRACDLFFTAEREYWLRRNTAGRIQKQRQDALGLGWANHDHHTYRSSRQNFALLIAFLERLGFQCRERFYAGKEAGWGAQVIEHHVTGITIFADVDLSPDEVAQDFSHETLPPRDQLGTVGLWCALHGEAFLQAGMHHLECQFDFAATRDQLKQAGIDTMPPFTDLPYLRQAFTRGEQWPVDPVRVEGLRKSGLITDQQARQFLTSGALGSHLEILQRDEGYKGFNQHGISEIISATDPRHAVRSSNDGA
ncbi:MAG: hypothetical protein JSS49_04120 [Planctomycetes bacterium]|nr:hypothetical protein [Planctomycetota bacterium]